MIFLKKFVFNPVQVNTFILYDETKEAVIIDAGCWNQSERDQLDQFISENELKPVKLINTHGHFDHMLGVEYVRGTYKLELAMHKDDEPFVETAVAHGDRFGIPVEPIENPEKELKDGEIVRFGNSELEVIHLPGHSPGGVAFYCAKQKFIIVGDVLFHGSIGRTDLHMGDYDTLIHSIKSRIMPLPEEVKVFPGHGPETSVGFEKRNNAFLR
ncbi:MBL fold metallo-hydrolase [Puteibacter caeruleilacunae]|nr:MBL fold metallo-hydrolase [Puteibacter caeruleilacunae]